MQLCSPWRACLAAACAILWALVPQVPLAAPHVPESDDFVLLTITDAAAAELAMRGRAGLGTGLTDVERIERARRYISEAVADGTQQGFGYAEALLQPWRDIPPEELPSDAAILMAFAHQHDHRFADALRLLAPLLTRDPYDTQALLLRAQILLTTADYPQARADCGALGRRGGLALAANCLAQLQALTGHVVSAYAMLDGLLAQEAYLDPADAHELRLTLAVLAIQSGKAEEALTRLRESQAAQPGSTFVLQLLVNQLLAQGLHEEAVARIDALPARRLTLDLQIGLLEGLYGTGREGRAEELREKLTAVFTEAAARKDGFPYKEHARFLLLTGADPVAALAAAQSNWQVQKDPDDLALLASAALAAADVGTLDSVRAWLRDTGLEDARISALLAEAP